MFWSGPRPSPLHWTCLNSFVRRGHRISLYTYDLPHCPPGVELRDAREICPENRVFHFWNEKYSSWDIAPFCDYFRLKMLSLIGGWYMDVDTICLADKFSDEPRVWANQGRFGRVNNAVLRFCRDDPILGELLRKAEEAASLPHLIKTREQLGPALITQVVEEAGLPRDMGASGSSFYPLRWGEMFKLWLPEFRDEIYERTQASSVVTIYNSWNLYAGIPEGTLPPKGSYLRDFVDDYRLNQAEFDQFGDEIEASFVREKAYSWLARNRWAIEQMKKEGVSVPDL